MAVKRPSFLKRQKEQQRVARAAEKREARRAKKHAARTGAEESDTQDPTAEEMESGGIGGTEADPIGGMEEPESR